MLVMFLPNFVEDTKIISHYDFVAPRTKKIVRSYRDLAVS